jgi:c-di-GMP-binding flagellar brake protein YcgR
MENESAFILRRPEQISNKLSVLLKNKRLLTAYYGEKNDSFVTTVLDVDKKANVFICDGCKESIVEQLLGSPKVIFETDHLGAKVVFNTTGLARTEHHGKLAFIVPMPGTMKWMEYREFYRLLTPVSMPSYCQLTLQGEEPVKLKLYDISIRGFSVLNNAENISELMVPEAHFEKCKLVLAETGENIVSFEVRNKCVINPEKVNRMERIGCKFTRITPAFEDIIQRYMLQIEREIMKKKEMGTVLY